MKMANEKRLKTCGECIHANICKLVNGGWFSRKNIAYCKGFKDRNLFVEVVRCKDCKYCTYDSEDRFYACVCHDGIDDVVSGDDFCSYGERRTE